MKQDLSSDVEELRGQAKSKDQQLEEFNGRLEKLDKVQVNSTKEIFDLKAKIKYIEWQWEKFAFQIKDNILAQASVIYLGADFSHARLHRHVVDGRIEDVPEDEDDKDNPELDPTNLMFAPWCFIFIFLFVYAMCPLWAYYIKLTPQYPSFNLMSKLFCFSFLSSALCSILFVIHIRLSFVFLRNWRNN